MGGCASPPPQGTPRRFTAPQHRHLAGLLMGSWVWQLLRQPLLGFFLSLPVIFLSNQSPMLSRVGRMLQQIVLAARALDLHECGLKRGQGGRRCRTCSCVTAGRMQGWDATSPQGRLSLVHHLPAVVGVCDVRSVGAPAPFQ